MCCCGPLLRSGNPKRTVGSPDGERTLIGVRETVPPARRDVEKNRGTRHPGKSGMHYFVTGATGFIGKRLVKTLLQRRGATVHFLLRPGSADKLADLLDYWGAGDGRAVAVHGDLKRRSALPQSI